jgi:hypothetical protein
MLRIAVALVLPFKVRAALAFMGVRCA